MQSVSLSQKKTKPWIQYPIGKTFIWKKSSFFQRLKMKKETNNGTFQKYYNFATASILYER